MLTLPPREIKKAPSSPPKKKKIPPICRRLLPAADGCSLAGLLLLPFDGRCGRSVPSPGGGGSRRRERVLWWVFLEKNFMSIFTKWRAVQTCAVERPGGAERRGVIRRLPAALPPALPLCRL